MKMNKIGLLALVFIFSCSSYENKPELTKFFNLQDYMVSWEADTYLPLSVSKTITIAGESETKEIEEYDFENEIGMLKNLNIDKPSHYGNYNIDTSYVAEDSYLVSYRSNHGKAEVKQLTISFEEGVLSKISIKGESSSLISSSNFELSFIPTGEIEMNKVQNLIFNKEKTSRVVIKPT